MVTFINHGKIGSCQINQLRSNLKLCLLFPLSGKVVIRVFGFHQVPTIQRRKVKSIFQRKLEWYIS